ncbi:Protein of unknown function (DUF2817) [Pseudomonas sp. GM21]|uniref:DUF2817 domain-containing protein n=1 Tax=Pseudomonas sp. GM21 TaxID=1144325 RepID=UPI0002725F8E|nr:DUF2817 domain-containing protein [Pseudomonas sp. GM21]EJM15200.1 Protein of unknown function (DUF2817) [Pseudomonas sp. GM21]
MNTGFPTRPSYASQRERFLGAATAAGARLTEYIHPLSGPFGEPLATDVALLGDPHAKKVLVMLSGTHGVEGFYGSNCQIKWLQTFTDRELPSDVALLVIHLINPWGTAWMRRVNEDNIDLNRNYLDFSNALPDNLQYEGLHEIYTCTQLLGPKRDQADALLDERTRAEGWSTIKSIVEAGQYNHSDGLFYGGQSPSWSNKTLHTIIQEHLTHAQVAMCFDLHTGAGDYGHPMLMTIAKSAYPQLNDAQALYGPWLYTLITGAGSKSGTGVAATATGYTSQAIIDALPNVYLMPFVIECGTYPGEQIHTFLRNDQWLHLHGDLTDEVARKIKLELLEQFYPADADWQELVWLRTRQIWERALTALPQILSLANQPPQSIHSAT